MADLYVICPFDKSHKILISRLQSHLLRCIKNHSMTEFAICPFNNQHIIDASQILEHCIICPNIKDVLTQTNIRENKNDSSNNNAYLTSTSACNSTTEIENDSTAHSNTVMKIEKFYLKSLGFSKNKESETFMKVLYVQKVEKTEKGKNFSQDALEKNIISEEHHKVTKNAGSINLNSHSCNQPKLLTETANDYGEIYRKLKALEEKEITIAKEMQILREKEKEIEKERKELIETLKNILFCTNTNNNHCNNNSNQEHKEIVACKSNEADTNIENNIDERNEQDSNTLHFKLEEKSENFQDIKPSSFSTPGLSPNTNKICSFGRGIMRAYNKNKILLNKTNRS